MTSDSRTLVLVPTYNELASLRSIVARIRASVPKADVLIIDDASPDGTGALADSLAATDARVGVLHRPGKQGLGAAYLAGFRHAITDDYHVVVEIDADGSHNPADLPSMLDLVDEGADLVIGSRWVPGGSVHNWPAARRLISRTGNLYSRLMLRSRIRDITAGYRAYRVPVLASLDLNGVSSQGYCFQVELAWTIEKRGFRVVEHPITFVERTEGTSKMHLGIVTEALWRVTYWGVRDRISLRSRRRSSADRDAGAGR
jgi:dolichol-phosphate mannosyltransferase